MIYIYTLNKSIKIIKIYKKLKLLKYITQAREKTWEKEKEI